MAVDLSYTSADEDVLNQLISGQMAGDQVPWPNRRASPKIKRGIFGVVSSDPRDSSGVVRPLALFCSHDDHLRLFSRFAQLRADFSPISAWCHVLPSESLGSWQGPDREAELWNMEAAWAGLVVAEAVLLSERPVSSLRIAACLATQSFAFARARAIWGDISAHEFMERYDLAHRILKTSESRARELRDVLEPIWASLSGVVSDKPDTSASNFAPIVHSLQALMSARLEGEEEEEVGLFAAPLRDVTPEADLLLNFHRYSSEQRLRVFDTLMSKLGTFAKDEHSPARQAVAAMAGYVATVAAGGSPNLSLAEASAKYWPEVTAWAYVIGGIGARVVWTSTFDGLGRLIVRELMRPLRIDEGPTCDFSLDEAAAVYDPQLSDPLVHLKVKQARIVSVSLYPGVNILVPIGEQATSEGRRYEAEYRRRPERPQRQMPEDNDFVPLLASMLWPHLAPRIRDLVGTADHRDQAQDEKRNKRSMSRKERAVQKELLLKSAEKNRT